MQVPRHAYRVVGDAGSDKVLIDVHLRGVTDDSLITVEIDPPHLVTVLVPDRYHLQLTLPVPISRDAEIVRFRPRMGRLRMLCTVISTTEEPEGAPVAGEHGQLQEKPKTAAAGHQQLLDDATAATAAETTQSTTAGSTQQLKCADAAGSGAGRRHQQQLADQATDAKSARQVQALGQGQKAKAAVAKTRSGAKAAAQDDTLQVTDSLHKARLCPSGNLSARNKGAALQQQQQQQQQPSPPQAGSNAPTQQQQQQQQQQGVSRAGGPQKQAITVDIEVSEEFPGFRVMLSQPRQHAPTLVGCWCAVYDALTLSAAELGLRVVEWAQSAAEMTRMSFGLCGLVALQIVAWLATGLVLLSYITTLLWQAAWLLPLPLLAAARVYMVWGLDNREDSYSNLQAAITTERQALREELQDNDSLSAGLTKLLLAGFSAALVWGVVWMAWQLGTHSLGGWVLAVPLLVWRVVVWLWRLVLWRPPSWYPVQLLLGGLLSLYCYDPRPTTTVQTEACTLALAPLQIVITAGGWAMLCSFALSVLWRIAACWDLDRRDKVAPTAVQRSAGRATAKEGTTHQLPPWWHAAAVGMFPAVARSWLLLLSHWGVTQAILSAVDGGVEAVVVLLAQGLGCSLSLIQAGLQLLYAACRSSLAWVPPGPVKCAAVSLLSAAAAHVTGLGSRLGSRWVQRAAGAVMGVLCWAAPAWYVGPLVQRACAASGVWQEGCLELLQPYAAQAPDSLSLSHSWWFTIMIHVWVGCICWQLVACRGGESGGRWLQGERQQRLEAARQRKEQKLQQRRQQKRHGH